MVLDDEYFMQQALKEAHLALEEDEVPVGAVVVIENRVIARGHNMVERLKDPTAHAEMIALTSAFNYLGAKYLPEASLYVTVEPCLMCAGAIYWGKIGRLVYGTRDPKNGYEHITRDSWPFHPKTQLVGDVLQEACSALMQQFFKTKRR